MTASEKFVSELCQKSFLPFWSFPNPIGRNGKELCDILVVCDPDVIIFSVKDISIKESGDERVDMERWQREAIEKSVKQIYGAERIIGLKEDVLLKDRNTKILLPKKGIRNIYRIAIAFGGTEKFPLQYGNFGKGFVHVYDERATSILLNELDTITDFIDYLKAKESFMGTNNHLVSSGAEDFLAFYFQHGLDVPTGAYINLQEGLWDTYRNSYDYLDWIASIKQSYLWDNLIADMYIYYEEGTIITQHNRNEIEECLRTMNRESRIARREISNGLVDFMNKMKSQSQTGARLLKAYIEGSPTYVFQNTKIEEREIRIKQLILRCMVAKAINQDSMKIVGIALSNGPQGFSYDICNLEIELNEKLNKEIDQIVQEFGFFKAAYTAVVKEGKSNNTLYKARF